MEISRAPRKEGKSGYPGDYRNDEGDRPHNYALYEPWEHMSPGKLKSQGHSNLGRPQRPIVNGGYPTGGYLKPATHDNYPAPELTEYPVSTKPAGYIPFDYNEEAATARRVERPITRGDRKALAATPLNDPGTVRVNTSLGSSNIVGVTYHPEGTTRGFVRAPIGPLDRQTGQNMRQHQDMDSRPVIRKWDAAQRGETWNESHADANRRVMTLPGREQGSEVMTDAIAGYAGGRRPKRWRRGKLETSRKK